jgi:hypothetical protein
MLEVRPWSLIVPHGVSLSNETSVMGEAEVTNVNFASWSRLPWHPPTGSC